MKAEVQPPPGKVRPARRLRGSLHLPSDKSIGHRALIANALSSGSATVRLRHPGDDLRSTVACLRNLGITVMERAEGGFEVTGGEWRGPAAALDCGNSGSTMRLLAGAIAGRPLAATLDGDASLRRRPMDRLAEPLRAMGVEVETDHGRPPLSISGQERLHALEHRLSVASAQLLGAIALAGLAAEGRTTIVSPGPTRDHTERLLVWMGVPIARDGAVTTVHGPARPQARSADVPGDPSAAAAWLVAASLHTDAEIELRDVSLNPTRLALAEALREMGATIEVSERPDQGPEPRGDMVVRSAGPLRALRIDATRAAALLDELPLLAVAMAAAEGVSELRGAGELRVKESDRIATTVAGLAAIGARVEELPDGWRVRRGTPRDAAITTGGDHRIAIAFAVAAVAGIAGELTVDEPACASVSYPTFWDDLASVAG